MRRFLSLSASIFFALLLSGCALEQKTKAVIGTNVWPGYERLYLARELVYYQKDKVELKEFSSATEVIRAFRNGLINGAALTIDEALLLLESEIEGKIVFVFDISDGADVIVAKKDITKMDQLVDKRVGVENTAVGAYILARALELNYMSENDIVIVPSDVSRHHELFKQNKIDAAVTFEPERTKILNEGANEIFSSKEIPNEIVDVLLVKPEIYENKELLTYIKEGFFKADKYSRANFKESIFIMAKRHGISSDEFKRSLNGLNMPDKQQNRELFSSGTIEKTLKQLKRVMLKKELLLKDVESERLLLK